MSAGTRLSRHRQKFAFLVCGGFGFALYYACSLALTLLGLRESVAGLLGVLIAIGPTYLLQKRIAFRHVGGALPSFAKYCGLQACNAVLIALLARVGAQAGLPPALNFVVSGAIVVVVSYLVLSKVVFRPPASLGTDQ